MKQGVLKKTSVSLGDHTAIVDEMRKKEDRSRSEVIRRAIDYYYLMNYVPEVTPTKQETKAVEDGMAEFRAGKGITLAELKQKYALGSTHRSKSKKAARKA